MREPRLVVSDSSPLIALQRIGQLDLLKGLATAVVAPPAVVKEVFGNVPAPAWLEVRVPQARLTVGTNLGAGEQEAIALSLEIDAAWVALDDLPARRLAGQLGLRVIGTVGILLAAKSAGLVTTVGPLLDALDAAQFRLSPGVRAAALRAAAELDPP